MGRGHTRTSIKTKCGAHGCTRSNKRPDRVACPLQPCNEEEEGWRVEEEGREGGWRVEGGGGGWRVGEEEGREGGGGGGGMVERVRCEALSSKVSLSVSSRCGSCSPAAALPTTAAVPKRRHDSLPRSVSICLYSQNTQAPGHTHNTIPTSTTRPHPQLSFHIYHPATPTVHPLPHGKTTSQFVFVAIGHQGWLVPAAGQRCARA
jgi:hypothetical protein